MPFLGVNIAILQDGRVLLTKREDFEVWCLPGGDVEDRETVAQAAIREAREETGLEVELTRLVGAYSFPSMPRGGSHLLLFTARPVGGAIKPARSEVVEIRYFDPSELPEMLFIGAAQEVGDALNGVGGGVVRAYQADWPFDPSMTRWDIYALRDRSGLSREAFYKQFFRPAQDDDFKLDVPPEGNSTE
jgi:ADP-ribose pyrophosphatase YjhB (NUDIX family)